MDKMVPFDVILFPADERAPHLVPLMTSNASSFPLPGQSGSQPPPPPLNKVLHPEMYMDFIAEGVGARAWRYHVGVRPSWIFFACFPPLPRLFKSSPSVFIFLISHHVRSRGDDPASIFFRVTLPGSPNVNQTLTRDRLPPVDPHRSSRCWTG